METKTYKATMELKEDGQPGEFRAVFATLNVTDYDLDVTKPGAFKEQPTIVEPWNHDWTLPTGKGIIKANDHEAWIEGNFFLDTEGGRENYQTVKNLGPLAEWSYTFYIVKAEEADPRTNNGANRALLELDVVGVSPVTRGAGINTRTERIKSKEKKTTDAIDDGEAGSAMKAADGNPSVDIITQINLAEIEVIRTRLEGV